jgi:hypothetical protein
MNWFDSWALTLTVLIPAVGAAALLLIPRAEEKAIKQVALLATLATFAATVAIGFRFKYDHGRGLRGRRRYHGGAYLYSRCHRVAVCGALLETPGGSCSAILTSIVI